MFKRAGPEFVDTYLAEPNTKRIKNSFDIEDGCKCVSTTIGNK